MDALKTALAGDDVEAIKSANEKLIASSQKLGEAIYSAASTEEAPTAEATNEDVVDAEVVDDEPAEEKK